MKPQKTPNSQSHLEKDQSWRHHDPWHYKATVMQTVLLYWHKNRHIDQWNRIAPKLTHAYMSTNLWQRSQEYMVGKGQSLNKWCLEHWAATCKRMKLDQFSTPHIKMNSKWIKDLNVRPETIKVVEENIGVSS